MNRATFSKAVVPGLFSFMTSSFTERPMFWNRVTVKKGSRRTYEESAYFTGLGLLPEKPEGEGIVYETLNIAAKWQLPLVFWLENNLYSQSTASEETLAGSIRCSVSMKTLPGLWMTRKGSGCSMPGSVLSLPVREEIQSSRTSI